MQFDKQRNACVFLLIVILYNKNTSIIGPLKVEGICMTLQFWISFDYKLERWPSG